MLNSLAYSAITLIAAFIAFVGYGIFFSPHLSYATQSEALEQSASITAIEQIAMQSDEEVATARNNSPAQVQWAVAEEKPQQKKGPGSELPARLVIPAIGLDAPIEYMGLNEKGEMDVPSGESENVGWYKHGTIPGKKGSAVIDAHVYAAFASLQHVPLGSDVYVITKGGDKLQFVVDDAKVYQLNSLSPHTLFNRKDAKRLNLITCAGTYISSWGTYDHRLVVYTKFVG